MGASAQEGSHFLVTPALWGPNQVVKWISKAHDRCLPVEPEGPQTLLSPRGCGGFFGGHYSFCAAGPERFTPPPGPRPAAVAPTATLSVLILPHSSRLRPQQQAALMDFLRGKPRAP